MRTISLTLLFVGCNPGSFQEYLDTAPIRVTKAPDNFAGTQYGDTVVALNGNLSGVDVGRVVVSGGGPALAFVRTYGNGKVSESTFLRCKNDKECADAQDIGTTMIPFERWGTGTNDARELCVYSPANATNTPDPSEPRVGGNGYVACEAPSNRPQSFTLGPQMAEVRGDEGTLKFSGFGLPSEHPVGVVLLGVHSIANRTSTPRNGGLYAQPDLEFNDNQSMNIAPYLSLVPLIDPDTGKPFSDAEDAGNFGAQVAGVASGKDLTFAVAQPSKQRVIVASYQDGASGEVAAKFRVHACIENATPGFGTKVAVGDLTDDGAPEIVVATEDDRVFVYPGSALPGPATDSCPGWDEPPLEVPCEEGQGPSCKSFGASLAIGDVDADGKGDLIVGGPLATVGGKSEVGAIWIVPGGSSGPEVERTVAIVVPSQERAHFGWNVAAVRTNGRDEPVASAPGVGEVYTLMCTPLESGFGGDGLCLD